MKHGRMIIFFVAVWVIFSGCASSDSGPSFTGSGGSGMRLGIIVPVGIGLGEDQSYLPRLVQGGFVSNIARHSAISVLDRVALDQVIDETLDAIYEDNLDIVRLGHVAQVAYMMTGSITRTSAGYALQINVTDTTPSANTIASYSGIHTAAQIGDFSAVNNASRELLEQMGVQLTTAAVNSLTRASPAQDIGAQTSLARGIVAQRRGTVVEALVHYHNAVSFDPRLPEASTRLSTLSGQVSSGNLGEDMKNEVRLHNEWIRILDEAEVFFALNPPFELTYSTSLTRFGMDVLMVPIELKPSASGFNVIHDIIAGLEATGRREAWGLTYWPTDRWRWVSKEVTVTAALLNESGIIISTTSAELSSEISFPVTTVIVREAWHRRGLMGWVRDQWEVESARRRGISPDRIWSQQEARREALEEKRNVTDTTRLEATEDQSRLLFTVNANDITDRITIRILSVNVNGVDVAQNSNFIRIVAYDGWEKIY